MLSLISKREPKTIWDYGLLIIIIAYSVVLSILSILEHYSFQTTAWDLGIYEQIFWSSVNSDKLLWYSVELPINPSGIFFGIHFAPILLVFLPIYWVFQTTETLLILQSVFLALGALPIYLIVKDEMNEKSAFAYACVYLLYPPLIGMNLFDFHVQSFLPFFFLFAFFYLKRQKWVPYFVFTILALMTIEFVPLIVMFQGFYGLWVCRKNLIKSYRIGLVKIFSNRRFLASFSIIVLALIWFILARYVLSFYNPNPRPHPNWKEFGDPVNDLAGFIFAIVSNPIRVFQMMFTPFNDKMFYIFGLFAPVGFLSFLSPPSLLIGTPWFLASLLSNAHSYFTPVGFQYVGFVIPFVFISTFYGSKRFIKFVDLFRGKVKNFKIQKIPFNVTIIRVFLVMLLLSSMYLYFSSQDFIPPEITYHDRVLENIIQLVPSNASILTQNDVFPHLSRRLYGYVGNNPVGNLPNIDFDYILVDTTKSWYIKHPPLFINLPLETFVPNVSMSGKYGFITAMDGIWLLKRGFVSAPTFTTERGVFGKFYNGSDLTGKVVFVSVFFDTDWDWTWQQPFPTTTNYTWSASFSSYLCIPVTGLYRFSVSVNGNYRLYINDNLTIYSNETGAESTDEILLQKGMCKIEIKYNKTTNPGTLKVSWKTPFKENYEVIHHDNLLWNISLYEGS